MSHLTNLINHSNYGRSHVYGSVKEIMAIAAEKSLARWEEWSRRQKRDPKTVAAERIVPVLETTTELFVVRGTSLFKVVGKEEKLMKRFASYAARDKAIDVTEKTHPNSLIIDPSKEAECYVNVDGAVVGFKIETGEELLSLVNQYGISSISLSLNKETWVRLG